MKNRQPTFASALVDLGEAMIHAARHMVNTYAALAEFAFDGAFTIVVRRLGRELLVASPVSQGGTNRPRHRPLLASLVMPSTST